MESKVERCGKAGEGGGRRSLVPQSAGRRRRSHCGCLAGRVPPPAWFSAAMKRGASDALGDREGKGSGKRRGPGDFSLIPGDSGVPKVTLGFKALCTEGLTTLLLGSRGAVKNAIQGPQRGHMAPGGGHPQISRKHRSRAPPRTATERAKPFGCVEAS